MSRNVMKQALRGTKWILVVLMAVSFLVVACLSLKVTDTMADAANVPVTLVEANQVFNPMSNTATNDKTEAGGDDRGLKLVSTTELVEYQTAFLTTGNAYLEFYLQDYTPASEFNDGNRRENIFTFLSLNELGGQSARYMFYLYQVWNGTQHEARYAIIYQDESYTNQTIVADVTLPFSYDQAVTEQIKLSLSFQPVAEKIVLSADGYDDSVCDIGGLFDFDPYFYNTRINLRGTIVVSQFNTYSFANFYNTESSAREFTMQLGNTGYVSDTGEGIFPETIAVDSVLSIHKTKLCFAFFVGSKETSTLDYTVNVYNGETQITPIDNGDYWNYIIPSAGDYKAVVNVTSSIGHALEKTYEMTCSSGQTIVSTLFDNCIVSEEGVMVGYEDVNQEVADDDNDWSMTEAILQGKTRVTFEFVELAEYVENTISKRINIVFNDKDNRILFQLRSVCTGKKLKAHITIIGNFGRSNQIVEMANLDTFVCFNAYTEFYIDYDPYGRTFEFGTSDRSQNPYQVDLSDSLSLPMYDYEMWVVSTNGQMLFTNLNDCSLGNENGYAEAKENLFCLDAFAVAYKANETVSFNKDNYVYNYFYNITEKSAELKDANGNACPLQVVGDNFTYTFANTGTYTLHLKGINELGRETTLDYVIKVLSNEELANREFSARVDLDSVHEALNTTNGRKFYVQYLGENDTRVYLPDYIVTDSCELAYSAEITVTSVNLSTMVKILADEEGKLYFNAELVGSYSVMYDINSLYGDSNAKLALSVVVVDSLESVNGGVFDPVNEDKPMDKIDVYLIIIGVECVLIAGMIVLAKLRKKKAEAQGNYNKDVVTTTDNESAPIAPNVIKTTPENQEPVINEQVKPESEANIEQLKEEVVSPVEVVTPIEDAPISQEVLEETPVITEECEPAIENKEDAKDIVISASATKTFEEQFAEADEEVKQYYKDISEYALTKKETRLSKSKSGDTYICGRFKLLQIIFQKGKLICKFMTANSDFKKYSTGKTVKIQEKPTIVRIDSKDAVEVAKQMMDISHKNIMQARNKKINED